MAKTSTEIRKLKEFLEKSLGTKVLEYDLKYLTKPGDNYGSIIQSLDVKVESKNGNDPVSITAQKKRNVSIELV